MNHHFSIQSVTTFAVFVEFENKEQCERAYQTMDQVLVDDSRIHVDFSQSVAKVWAHAQRHRQKAAAAGSTVMQVSGSKRMRTED